MCGPEYQELCSSKQKTDTRLILVSVLFYPMFYGVLFYPGVIQYFFIPVLIYRIRSFSSG